jgi:hypothetical protein
VFGYVKRPFVGVEYLAHQVDQRIHQGTRCAELSLTNPPTLNDAHRILQGLLGNLKFLIKNS